MSCRQYERSIALRAGGDLPREDEMRLEAHLAVCPRCRRFAAGLQESQDALLRWRSESPAEDLLENVQRGVMTRIAQDNEQSRSRPRTPIPAFSPKMRFAFGVAASCVLLAVLWLASPQRMPEPEAEIGKNEPAAAAGVPDATAVAEKPVTHDPGKPAGEAEPAKRPALRAAVLSPAVPAAQVAPQSQKSEAAAPPPPLRIELQTADPNIRIIWFVQQALNEKATGPTGRQEPGSEIPVHPPACNESIFIGRSFGPTEATDERL